MEQISIPNDNMTVPQASSSRKYQICTRCICDTTLPGITFDAQGVCSFCKVHDKLDNAFSLNGKAQKLLTKTVKGIRTSGTGKYDCILGISGGRDSIYTLYLVKKVFGLRPLAVHFNNGFGNPVAGENMVKATEKLGVPLRTITSDWREAKDLKLVCLKASTPDLDLGTDIGLAAALYGVATQENVKHILIGQSFRTEGIAPLSWNYLDGKYLKSLHRQFGTYPLRPWKPADPGFNLDIWHMFYYAIYKRIRVIPVLYYVSYIRKSAEEIIKKELGWVYPGAHYYDDLYQSLITYVLRMKFNIDRRKFNYSALIRSGQMEREEALKQVQEVYAIEDPKVIDLCIKRLGVTKDFLAECMARPAKTFRDYPNRYAVIAKFKYLIKVMSRLQMVPSTTYDKYFHCGA